MSSDATGTGGSAANNRASVFTPSTSASTSRASSPTNKLRSVSSPPTSAASQKKVARVLGPESLTADPVEEEEEERERVAAGQEPTREEMRIDARVNGAEIVKDASGEYVSYTVFIATGAHHGLSWKVARRFKEFESLHAALVKEFGADHLPTLPSKSMRRTLDPEYIRKKKTELTKYLSDLVLDSGIVGCEPISHFLLRDVQDLVRCNIDHLRGFASLREQMRELEAELLRKSQEQRSQSRRLQEVEAEAARVQADLEARLKAAEDATAMSNNEITLLHAAWEAKFSELVAHSKELKQEKKTALKLVRDFDATCRRLKAEKKVLIKEVKENRAQLAAFGVLGHGPSDPSQSGAPSELTSGAATPALTLASPSPQPSPPPQSTVESLVNGSSTPDVRTAGSGAASPPTDAEEPPEVTLDHLHLSTAVLSPSLLSPEMQSPIDQITPSTSWTAQPTLGSSPDHAR